LTSIKASCLLDRSGRHSAANASVFEKVSAGGAPGAQFDGIGAHYLPAGERGQLLRPTLEPFLTSGFRRGIAAIVAQKSCRGAKATLAN
jgi:hypothetical protein